MRFPFYFFPIDLFPFPVWITSFMTIFLPAVSRDKAEKQKSPTRPCWTRHSILDPPLPLSAEELCRTLDFNLHGWHFRIRKRKSSILSLWKGSRSLSDRRFSFSLQSLRSLQFSPAHVLSGETEINLILCFGKGRTLTWFSLIVEWLITVISMSCGLGWHARKTVFPRMSFCGYFHKPGRDEIEFVTFSFI